LLANLNAGRWFTFSVYTGTYNGMARNRVGFDFHWKYVPIFMYLDMRSHDYLKSWTLDGASITIGGALAF
jgi:hypothetical protein